MHGRRPLPDAKHTFPASPDLWKFWGTPLSKNYFKWLGYYLAYSTLVVGLNYYITRNEIGEFGYESLRPAEEIKAMIELRKVNYYLNDLGLSIHQRSKDMLGFNKEHDRPNMVFDDGIDFVPPEVILSRNTASA